MTKDSPMLLVVQRDVEVVHFVGEELEEVDSVVVRGNLKDGVEMIKGDYIA